MKQMWLKTVVALAFVLTFAACAKKDSGSSGSSPAAKEVDKNAKPPAAPAKTPPSQIINKDKADSQKGPKTSTSVNPSGTNPSQNKLSNSDSGFSADADVERMLREAKMYSGSASDYLRTLLQVVQNNVSDPLAKTRNLKMANSVSSASLKIDHNGTGDVALSLSLGSSDKDKITGILGGTLGLNRETKLAGKVGKFQITGDLKCMDEVSNDGPTCENSIVSLNINRATVKLLMRRTNVGLNAEFPNVNCKSDECEKMYNLFRQTDLAVQDPNTVKTAKVESFEVIQGRSGFRLILITNANQVITAGGPLLNADEHSGTNVVADRSLHIEDLVDLRSMQNYKTDLQASLKDVRIVGNNGRGQITLQVRMKVLEGKIQDSFKLTLERKQRDVMSTAQPLSSKVSQN